VISLARNVRLAGLILLMLLAPPYSVSPVEAASLSDLGKPMSVQSPSAAFPLSGFHHTTHPFAVGRKPAVLFLGTNLAQIGHHTLNAVDAESAVERWPMVKALAQFGAWSGLQVASQTCVRSAIVDRSVCSPPSFQWSGSHYSSRYIVFQHRDLLTATGKRFQSMNRQERAAYYRFSRNPGTRWALGAHDRRSAFYHDNPDYVLSTVVDASFPSGGGSTRRLPLVMVGSYVSTLPQVAVAGEFSEQVLAQSAASGGTPAPSDTSNYSFARVHQALERGQEVDRYSHFVADINAEANIMVALICHADNMRPSSVCTRATIRQILRFVR